MGVWLAGQGLSINQMDKFLKLKYVHYPFASFDTANSRRLNRYNVDRYPSLQQRSS